MSGFKNTTRTVSGHHHWGGGSVGGGTGSTINRLAHGGAVDRIGENPGHPEIYPKEGNREAGNAAQLRKKAPTQELQEHGGRGPLTAGFKKGGAAKHFHVHKHYHAKGGQVHSVSHSYSAAEKHAETYAAGGHVIDSTHVSAGGPDYKRGGKARKPVRKNAGGALYGVGGNVGSPVGRAMPPGLSPLAASSGALARPVGGGGPMGAQPAASGLSALAARPRGLSVRPQLPMRRPMPMPGPSPMARAKGGRTR